MVSVIIPSHKGAEGITARCVAHVKASTYKDIEVIVINEGYERSRQRNMGIRRATGKYLLFLDSDQFVAPDLIERCVATADMWDLAGLYIPEVIVTDGWFGRLRNWERTFYTGTAVDVVRFVRFKNMPFFDEKMHGPEDSDWDRRIKGSREVVNSYVYHCDNVGVIDYLKKKAYYTKSMQRFAEKWPGDKVLNFKWRCWTVFTGGGKWRKLLACPLRACGLVLLLIARGLVYICARKKTEEKNVKIQ